MEEKSLLESCINSLMGGVKFLKLYVKGLGFSLRSSKNIFFYKFLILPGLSFGLNLCEMAVFFFFFMVNRDTYNVSLGRMYCSIPLLFC
jgi:hypothetical protein